MKIAKKICLMILFVSCMSIELQASGSIPYADRIKECCVRVLPKSWQPQARVWFWPTVVCTATVCAAVCWWVKHRFFPGDPRTVFTNMAYDLLTADPLVSGDSSRGPYGVSVNIFQDGSGGTIHFLHRDRQFYAQILRAPFVVIGPVIYDAVEAAMQRLPRV